MESIQPPALTESSSVTVNFPERDESMGEIMVTFLGPNCNDPLAMAALETLGTFLAGSSVSVLEHELVEIKNPWASSVQFYTEERPNTLIWLQLTAVETGKLEGAEKRLFEVLKETVSEALDLEYMRECLRRTKRQKKFSVESSGYYFSNPIIVDFLFGKRDGSTLKSLQTLGQFDELERWSGQEWAEFLRKWLVENPHVTIYGCPSARLAKTIEEEEKRRVATQVKKLGPDGLCKLQEKLDAAKAINEQDIPKVLLERFKIPGVDSIHFIDTTVYSFHYCLENVTLKWLDGASWVGTKRRQTVSKFGLCIPKW